MDKLSKYTDKISAYAKHSDNFEQYWSKIISDPLFPITESEPIKEEQRTFYKALKLMNLEINSAEHDNTHYDSQEAEEIYEAVFKLIDKLC